MLSLFSMSFFSQRSVFVMYHHLPPPCPPKSCVVNPLLCRLILDMLEPQEEKYTGNTFEGKENLD